MFVIMFCCLIECFGFFTLVINQSIEIGGTWVCVPNFTAIHPVVVELFHKKNEPHGSATGSNLNEIIFLECPTVLSCVSTCNFGKYSVMSNDCPKLWFHQVSVQSFMAVLAMLDFVSKHVNTNLCFLHCVPFISICLSVWLPRRSSQIEKWQTSEDYTIC